MMQLEQLLGSTISEKDDPRLAFYQKKILDRHASNVSHDIAWLTRQGSRLQLPDPVLETALAYLRRLRAKGRNCKRKFVREGVLLLACRAHGTTKRVREIVGPDRRTRGAVRKMHEVADILGVDVRQPDSNRIIFRAVEKLGLPRQYYHETLALVSQLERELPSGHPRHSNAAAMIYLLAQRAGQWKSQKDVASSFGMVECVVSQRVTDLKKVFGGFS